jgi:thioredoxin reductase
MTDLVAIGGVAALGIFVLAVAVALEATGRRRRLAVELASQPDTPPSLYPRINRDACICSGACVAACPERDVIAILDGRPQLIRASACVGHADCLRSCPVSAIELVLGSAERAVEVPVVSATFETTVAGLYVAGEITGIGLIHNAVAQGRQAARAALDGLGRSPGNARREVTPIRAPRPTGPAGDRSGPHAWDVDLLIVGAGPAGIGAALEARHRGARAAVLEKGAWGGAIRSYPRQKIVMSAPFELPVIGKVKLRRTSKEALIELFDDVIRRAELDIIEHAEVTAIWPSPGGFRIETRDRAITARRVVLAIGRRGTPRRLGVPGADLPHIVYAITDPAAHAGQPIAVVGGGDSAVEIALALAAQPRTAVTLVHRGGDFGRCKPDNQHAIEAARADGRLAVQLGSQIRAVTRDRLELTTPGGPIAVPASLVVCCLGAELPSQWLRGLGVALRELRGEPLI